MKRISDKVIEVDGKRWGDTCPIGREKDIIIQFMIGNQKLAGVHLTYGEAEEAFKRAYSQPLLDL